MNRTNNNHISSIAQELADILEEKSINNSYYNDENYVSCKTIDFNKAYKTTQKIKTVEELESVAINPSTNKQVKCLDLVKLTLLGDFDGQLKKSSSREENTKSLIHIADLAKNNLNILTEKEAANKNELDQEEYKYSYAKEINLIYIIARAITEIATNEEGYTSVKKLIDTLKDLPEFNKEIKNKMVGGYKGTKNFLLKEGSTKPDPVKIKKLEDICKALVSKNIKEAYKLTNNLPYYIKEQAILYILIKTTTDEEFTEALEKERGKAIALRKSISRLKETPTK